MIAMLSAKILPHPHVTAVVIVLFVHFDRLNLEDDPNNPSDTTDDKGCECNA